MRNLATEGTENTEGKTVAAAGVLPRKARTRNFSGLFSVISVSSVAKKD